MSRPALPLAALVLGLGVAALPVRAVAQHGEEAAPHGEAADHGEADAHGDHGAVHEPEWDYTRLAGQLVNFGIWAFLLVYVIRSRAPGFLGARRAALVEGLEEARRIKEEAERKVEMYTSRIDNLDAELDRLRAEMQEGGKAERDRIVKDAADRAAKMHAEAKFLIEQQMKSLREELTREAIEAAVGAAEKILREKAGATDQERLATEYLAQLEQQLKASAPGPSKESR